MSSFTKLKLPGQLLLGNNSFRDKCQERSITFKKIAGLLGNNKLKTPQFQTVLDEDKVNEMILSYKKNRNYLIFKNKIVIGVIPDYVIESIDNYVMYVIDGQHRIEMAKQMAETGINDYLTFCYYETTTNKEMKKLFLEINKDSHKNSKYVALDEFNQNTYDQFKKYLHENERSFLFSQKKKANNRLYSICELMDLLVERKYMEKYSFEELKEDFENKNKIFYRKIDYIEYLNDDPNCFYEGEKTPIENEYICSLKNNNFIDFLVDTENKVIPDHKFKKMKDSLSPRLRIIVWTLSYGECTEGPCPLCNTLINSGKNGFHCGHIISEANGGQAEPRNLRPICALCNAKMGSTNWDDYEKLRNNKKKHMKDTH